MFTQDTKAIVFGLQLSTIQAMLDFDFLCGNEPSVLACIVPGKNINSHKLFFGNSEILLTSYPDLQTLPEHIKSKTDTFINLASFRSAFDATKMAIESGIFKNIIIVAEGIPERQTREIIAINKKYNLNILGPATVGAMEAGVFRAGNTGGALENIIASKLYQTGSVGFVSKSGGMSNEMRKVIADKTNGSSLSIALGGDKYNIMTFKEAITIMEKREDIKMIVLLGEVGGKDEGEVAEMIQRGEVKKPVVAWCIGTIGEQLKGEVQFGHAGAKSNKDEETASYKNTQLKKSGAIVPESYIDFGDKIAETYKTLGIIKEENNILEEKIQERYHKIKQRQKTLFSSSISDERGDELMYNKKPISDFVKQGSISSVISNLWFKRDFPPYAEEFINTIIILLADHGPAVSGATNAIITARAGNDVKSSLIAGLSTIGPRFGGAIDGASKYFFDAVQKGISADNFVNKMKQKGINIPGIGHKVKSKFHPDSRCEILDTISKKFPNNKYLNFGKAVAEITLEKKPNLILNVDGYIACMLLDLLENIHISTDEIKMYIDAGIGNSFFILARSIGFIGHIIDQKRFSEGLYRTPWNNILYL